MAELGAVIDTAPLLAYVGGAGHRLGAGARRMLHRADRGGVRVVVPVVCLFEAGQLEERGRVAFGVPFDQWCDRLEGLSALHVISLDRPHVSEARALPALRDPFDRLIAGTAIALGLPLITPDTRIAESGRVRVIW